MKCKNAGIAGDWTKAEIAVLTKIITTRSLSVQDAWRFPDRSWNSVHQKAAKLRRKMGIGNGGMGRPRKKGQARSSVQSHEEFIKDAEEGSRLLLKATVCWAINNNRTLPGLSPAHTIALARNLGVWPPLEQAS